MNANKSLKFITLEDNVLFILKIGDSKYHSQEIY